MGEVIRVMKTSRYGVLLMLIAALAMPAVFAGTSPQSGIGALKNVICDLYKGFKMLLGPAALLMALGAAVIYAAGQILGAEMRARANVWAHAMFLGAVIGLVLANLIPWLLDKLYQVNNSGGSASSLGDVCS